MYDEPNSRPWSNFRGIMINMEPSTRATPVRRQCDYGENRAIVYNGNGAHSTDTTPSSVSSSWRSQIDNIWYCCMWFWKRHKKMQCSFVFIKAKRFLQARFSNIRALPTRRWNLTIGFIAYNSFEIRPNDYVLFQVRSNLRTSKWVIPEAQPGSRLYHSHRESNDGGISDGPGYTIWLPQVDRRKCENNVGLPA